MTIAFPTLGFSDAAQFVEKEYTEERKSPPRVKRVCDRQCPCEEMATVWNECRESNWDGHDAMPVTQGRFAQPVFVPGIVTF